MIRKYSYIPILIIFSVYLVLGAIGGCSDNNGVGPTPTPTPSPTPTPVGDVLGPYL